jgi:F-type H+-transporting ATPase subunit b
MDATLHALGGILLKAVPTFLLVILLHFYLKAFFFKPLQKVLRQRYEATEGARKRAGECLERTSAKAAEYEAAMRAARDEIHRTREHLRRQLLEREAAELEAARRRAEAAVEEIKAQLAKDVEAAKPAVARDSEALANQIAESILRRSAA